MIAFQTIRARAEQRKGGADALARLMPPKPDPKALIKLGDDRVLAEMTRRVFSAGFAWSVIESKWPGFEAAFLGFEPARLVFEPDEFWDRLVKDARIVRNGAKIGSVRDNARVALDVIAEYGSLDAYLWSFVGGKPLVNRWSESQQVPAKTELSDQMSKALAKRGFRFVGSTICYAFMQATGMVNDHLVSCFRYEESGHAEH